ncbi:hypothetical protein [Rhodoplanes sp. SY1]|uniref:hypothetical protein n=1 Tax=Rhodoplanes sp. SY1 TaxID=3166646 RepID=UPI0038B5B4FD
MQAQRPRDRKGRSRRPIPRALPNDLYDYADDRAQIAPRLRRAPSPRIYHVENLPVTDDWPEDVPVTEAEIDVFERYFGDLLDRLFGLAGMDRKDLMLLSTDDNNRP